MVLRGYDRAAVEAWREEIAATIERLEEQAPRETAVKRALDEVGQETASILQRAHEAAEEITARSRSQADGRLERAEREAEETLRDAEQRVERLEEDLREMWEDRTRLIEEMRQLADEVLAVADDAIERLPAPETTEAEPAVDGDDPTVEVQAAQLEPSGDGAEVDEQPTVETPAVGPPNSDRP